jgi:hypothetical protein
MSKTKLNKITQKEKAILEEAFMLRMLKEEKTFLELAYALLVLSIRRVQRRRDYLRIPNSSKKGEIDCWYKEYKKLKKRARVEFIGNFFIRMPLPPLYYPEEAISR